MVNLKFSLILLFICLNGGIRFDIEGHDF